MAILLFSLIIILIVSHLIIITIYNYKINPYEASIFTKFFPYEFLFNLYFSSNKTKKSYFSLRVDINTSRENVKQHNEGLAKLIILANQYEIPITFSIASEYIPSLSEEVKELICEPRHEIISHGHIHSDLTQKNQAEQIKKSKLRLEEIFNKDVKGLVAPQAKHDFSTLKAAEENGIKYLSAGSLSYIRYWSFPYPFKKQSIWLIGGGIPSDHYLYQTKNRSAEEALHAWRKAIQHRSERGWFNQLEYHNFSTSKEKLEVLEELFQFISSNGKIEPTTQGEFLRNI